jgi:transcription antitermination factor NusG
MNPKEPTTDAWYAISVRHKFEQMVSAALAGKGYEEYLPLHRSTRSWSDRSKELDLPLFPGYLFCRFDVQFRLPILTTPGVIAILGAGKTPVAVPERELDAVKTVVGSGLHLVLWPQLAVGSSVLIERGPLKGLEGITLDIKKKCRLIVSVPLLQRSVAVEIERDWVRPLSTSNAARRISPGLPSVAKVA